MKIRDEKLLNLVHSGCKSTDILPNSGPIVNEDGVPLGGLLSPLLANIYLHFFDQFMEKEVQEHNIGLLSPHFPIVRTSVRQHANRNARKTGLQPADQMSDQNKKMAYVRYADNFIIGLNASHQEAIKLKARITDFLDSRLELELNQEKTVISDTSRKGTKFLGYVIHLHSGLGLRNKKGKLRQSEENHVVLHADRDRVVRRLAEVGFCTKDGDPRPKFSFLSDSQAVINHKVNQIFRGIMEYYKLADNRKQFGCHLFFIFSHSLAKLYSAKFRWHRRAIIFKIAGRDLSKPIKMESSVIGKKGEDLLQIEPIIYSEYRLIKPAIKRARDPHFAAS